MQVNILSALRRRRHSALAGRCFSKTRYFDYFLIFCFCSFWNAAYAAGNRHPVSTVHTQVYDLRCQSLRRPVGIGEERPFFSWKISSDKHDVKQVAYQVSVASSLEKLETSPDMWNSGKVTSDQNTFIRYRGKPLKSAMKYYWKVKVWVNKETGGSGVERSFFVTALLQADAWKDARWIGYKALPDSLKVFPGVPGSGDRLGAKAKNRDIIPYFRKQFYVKKAVRQAYLFVCGLGQYVLFMNGKRVDTGFLNPAWSDYTKRCYYNSYDITSRVKQGANVIGSIVGNGFLYINRERYHKLVIAAGYPMLRLKMMIRYTDGSTKTIVTNGSWKTAPSAVIYSSIYGGEDFDANRIEKGWNSPGFDAGPWKQAVVVPGPGGKMQAQESYPVTVNESFHPARIDSSRKDIRIYDFGQNVSGIIRLKASGRRGYRVRIIPSELVNEDNTPDQRATGQPYYWDYIFGGGKEEVWQPLFSYYGFRYAAVEVFDPAGKRVNVDAVNIRSLTSLHTQNAAPQAGSFSCSDTLFNKIFELIRWGIRNNMSNVATDCPHREKLGWLEQSHLMGNSIQFNYDILKFYHKIAADMTDAQLPDGLVPDIAPEYVIFNGGFRDSPEWGSACVLVPWYVYQWYGDKDILRKSYTMMKRYVKYLGSRSHDNLLAYGLGDWFDLGPKRPGVSQLTPLGLTATAFYYYDASTLSKVAAVLGYTQETEKYAALAKRIRQAFNQKYFNPQTHVYATGSQTSYAIPLYFGIAPPSEYKAVFANLVDSIRKDHYALTAGDIGFRYVVQVLERNQAGEIIYKMNNRSDVPGYGYQIKKGATSLTESWRALRNVSNDHMMLGHLMEWFYSGLGGIRQQPGSVGYKKILIAPQFVHGINRVHASYNTVNGPVSVQWEKAGNGRINLHVHIPANTTAKIKIPVYRAGRIKENGKAIRERNGNGILHIYKKKGVTMVETGSGRYDFSFVYKKD